MCANLMQTQSSAKILLLEHQKAVSAVDRINGFWRQSRDMMAIKLLIEKIV